MITKEQAVALGESGGTIYHATLRNGDGSAVRARVNGKCKTWKRRPNDWRLPMKHGLRECFYLGTDVTCGQRPEDWLTYDRTGEARQAERRRKQRAMFRKLFKMADDTPNRVLRDRIIDEGHLEAFANDVCECA